MAKLLIKRKNPYHRDFVQSVKTKEIADLGINNI